MKPTAKSPADSPPLLAFGAHPDDIEFGCGGIVARETRAGRRRISSSARAASPRPTARPRVRTAEAREGRGAPRGDARVRRARRRRQPGAQAGPCAQAGRRSSAGCAPASSSPRASSRTSTRTIRGSAGSCATPPGSRATAAWRSSGRSPAHAIGQLLYYAVTPEAEPAGVLPVLIDISDARGSWRPGRPRWRRTPRSCSTRNYVELQLARARVHGLRAGVGVRPGALSRTIPLVFGSLAPLDPDRPAILTWNPAAP